MPNHALPRPLRRAVIRLRSRIVVPVLVAGAVGGAAGTLYALALEGLQHLLWPEGRSAAVVALALVSVGLVVGVVEHRYGAAGSVELLVDNIHVSGGNGDIGSTVRLVPLSLLCIASGGALGPEAPLVQANGTIGSWIGRRFRLRPEDVRVCTITGMASAFALLLGAPLGAAFFALEILHRRGLQYYEALLPAIVGALTGFAVNGVAVGWRWSPPWTLVAPPEITAVDLAWAAGAGVLGAVVAMAFDRLTATAAWIVRSLPRIAVPVVAAAAMAITAVFTPYALTNGEDQFHLVIGLAPVALAIAAGAKFAMVAISLACRWKGGFVLPLMFIGAALGELVHRLVPSTNEAILITAVMAAILVGVTKTPIGSTLVVTEMTSTLLLPTTLVAATIALVLTRRVHVIDTQRDRAPARTTDRPVDSPPTPAGPAR